MARGLLNRRPSRFAQYLLARHLRRALLEVHSHRLPTSSVCPRSLYSSQSFWSRGEHALTGQGEAKSATRLHFCPMCRWRIYSVNQMLTGHRCHDHTTFRKASTELRSNSFLAPSAIGLRIAFAVKVNRGFTLTESSPYCLRSIREGADDSWEHPGPYPGQGPSRPRAHARTPWSSRMSTASVWILVADRKARFPRLPSTRRRGDGSLTSGHVRPVAGGPACVGGFPSPGAPCGPCAKPP